MHKTTHPPRTPSLNPLWKQRLVATLGDVLDLCHYPVRQGEGMRGESRNSRTILQTFERKGELETSSLQLALPGNNELEMLKLGCWTLLWLKSLFPDWQGVEAWVENAANRASESKGKIEQQLSGYLVACRYDPTANVLEYQVSKSRPGPS